MHLHSNNVRVHWLFSKSLEITHSIFLDGILGIWYALFWPVIINRLQYLDTIFISLNYDGLQNLLWTYFDSG